MSKKDKIDFFKDVGKTGVNTVKLAGQAIIVVGATILATSLIKNTTGMFHNGGTA
jgi:hypothetical protein